MPASAYPSNERLVPSSPGSSRGKDDGLEGVLTRSPSRLCHFTGVTSSRTGTGYTSGRRYRM